MMLRSRQPLRIALLLLLLMLNGVVCGSLAAAPVPDEFPPGKEK